MEEISCEVIFVSANMMHRFQLLDLTINGVAKKFTTTKFKEWYAKEIARQINARVEVYSVELETSPREMVAWFVWPIEKPTRSDKRGLEESGINEAFAWNNEPEDPSLDIDSNEDE